MKTITLLMNLLLLISVTASAGNKVGNGGGGQECDTPDGVIRSLQSYDLIQGSSLNPEIDLDDQTPAAYVEEEVWRRVHTAAPGFEARLRMAMAEVEKRWNPQNDHLAIIPDADLRAIQPGCHYVQLADWNDSTGLIYVDQTLVSQMLPSHQVALKFHEAIYFLQRNIRFADDSDVARLMVGTLFQDNLTYITEVFGIESKLGIGFCQPGLSGWCKVNWSSVDNYSSQEQKFEITVELLDKQKSLKVNAISNPGDTDHRLNRQSPIYQFTYDNSAALATAHGIERSSIGGMIILELIQPTFASVPVKMTIRSLASGEVYSVPLNIKKNSGPFSFSW
jgi:hypothetical protein